MKIRKYKNKDEIQILKLDRLVEEHPWNRRNLKNWYWKYKGKNPFGRSLVWVAEKEKKIVATFSVIPLEYILDKKTVLGGCSIAMINYLMMRLSIELVLYMAIPMKKLTKYTNNFFLTKIFQCKIYFTKN